MADNELRIGICSCSEFYNGKLQGKTIEIPEGSNSFSIVETVIFDKKQRPSIRQNRPHLFLDVHPVKEGYNTELALINLYPTTRGRGDQVFIGMTSGMSPNLEKRWNCNPQPATVEEILVAIPELVLWRGRERFNKWLTRMTPPGWVMSGSTVMIPENACMPAQLH